MRLTLSRPVLAGMLFVVALPFNFVYSYLVARGLFPIIPGLVGLMTYGLLISLLTLAPTDTKIWRHRFIVVTLIMLAYALVTALLYRFAFTAINPEVDRELFDYHSINIIRSLAFLLIGIHLTCFTRIGQVAVVSASTMALVVFANIDMDSLSLRMPDVDELEGMYLFLGDTFAVTAIVAIAYLRRSIFSVAAIIVSVVVLYVIGTRTSLYAFVLVAYIYAILLTRNMQPRLYRIASKIFITTLTVIGIVATLMLTDASQNRMLAFIVTGEDSSWAFRAWQLSEGLSVIWENPVFGQYGSDYLLLNRFGDYIHSYLEIWRQFGIVPFTLFLIALVGAARTLWSTRARAEEPAWRMAVLLMVFSGIEITFARTWGSPYIFAAIGMAANYAPTRRQAGRHASISDHRTVVSLKDLNAKP